MFLHNVGQIFSIFVGGPLLEAQFFVKFACKIGILDVQTWEWASIIEHGPVREILQYFVCLSQPCRFNVCSISYVFEIRAWFWNHVSFSLREGESERLKGIFLFNAFVDTLFYDFDLFRLFRQRWKGRSLPCYRRYITIFSFTKSLIIVCKSLTYGVL